MSKIWGSAPRYYPVSEGTLAADGNEQTVVELSSAGVFLLTGWIDLSELQLGDSVMIRQYGKVTSGGDYKKYAGDAYPGPITNPLLFVETRPGTHGLKLTLQQTAGPNRNFPHLWYKYL